MVPRLETIPHPKGLLKQNLSVVCVGGFALVALASYGFAAYDLLRALTLPYLDYTVVDRDFANYWLAGRLLLSGEYLDLFDHYRYFPHLQELFGTDYQIRSWSYPPHYLLLVWPLGLVDYRTGLVGFLGGTLLLFALAVTVFRRQFAPRSDLSILFLALLGYALMMLVAAQNGFLTAALLLLGLTFMRRRPTLAGLAFACLTIKPQLGVLIPVLLAFDRNWRALLWSAVFTALLVALSVILFGIESWSAYLTDTLAYQSSVMTEWYGIFLRMMPTVFAGIRTLGFSSNVAAQAQLPVTLVAVVVVLWLLYREHDPLRRAFVVTCGTFLITPYAFNYDMGALCVCAALLAAKEQGKSRDQLAVLPIALVAAIAGAVTNFGRINLPLTPLVLAAGLAAVAAAARRPSEDPVETRAPAPTGS